MSSSTSQIRVGTASWTDPGFVERWYPPKMPAGERLGWYAQHFQIVEVNSTFYSVPDARMVERWCAATPADFVFDVKLHQLLSQHATPAKLLPPALQKKAKVDGRGKVLADAATVRALIKELRISLEMLRQERKLGALLLQMSPSFSPRKHRLEELYLVLDELADFKVALELRNRNWAVGEQLPKTLAFLARRQVAFVDVDAPGQDHFTIMPPDLDVVTTPQLAYLRLHGRNAKAYLTGKTVAARFDYDYNDREIDQIADRSGRLAREAKEVHVIFNNNNLDYAPRAGLKLRKVLGQIKDAGPEQRELFAKRSGA